MFKPFFQRNSESFDYDRDVLKREVLVNVSDSELNRVKRILEDFPQLFISEKAYAKSGQLVPDSFAVVLRKGETVSRPDFLDRLSAKP